MIDLAHTSDATMREVVLPDTTNTTLTKKKLTTRYQVIAMSKAPVVWTHAGARAIRDHPRNVPDDILELIGDGPGKNHGIM
jgi:membrane dipeptidase